MARGYVWRSKTMGAISIFQHKVVLRRNKIWQGKDSMPGYIGEFDCIHVCHMNKGDFNPMDRAYIYEGTVVLGPDDYVELVVIQHGWLELRAVIMGGM